VTRDFWGGLRETGIAIADPGYTGGVPNAGVIPASSDVQTQESKINIQNANFDQTFRSFVRMMIYGGH